MVNEKAEAGKTVEKVSGSSTSDESVSESPQVQNTETERVGDPEVVDAEMDPVLKLVQDEFAALATGFQGWSKSLIDRFKKFEKELGFGPESEPIRQLKEFTVIVKDDCGDKIYHQKIKDLDLVRLILFVNNLQMNTNATPPGQ